MEKEILSDGGDRVWNAYGVDEVIAPKMATVMAFEYHLKIASLPGEIVLVMALGMAGSFPGGKAR